MINDMLGVFEVPLLLEQVVIAIAIGGLIGLEREKESQDKFAGLRTLALLCGAGPVIVHYSELSEYPIVVLMYLFLSLTLALAIVAIRYSVSGGKDLGFTTSVTVFFVSLLGILVGFNQYTEAAAIGIVVAFILAEKQQMVKFIDKLTYEELSDAMKVGALIFILYPILPADPVDPYGVVSLREVLIFAIFVLMIEFSAYISMRVFGGSKGLQVTGLLAGMANSFATAAVMARMANKSREAVQAASSGIMLSVISMIVRNVGLASIIAIGIFYTIWIPTVVMVLTAIVIAYYLLRISDSYDNLDIDIDSPFSFKSAAKFSVIYVGITLVSVVAQELLGEAGLFMTAYTGGLISSAAVAVSAATVYNSGAASAEVAGGMVLLGILASLTSKIVLIEIINGQMRKQAMLPMGIIGLIGIGVYFIV
jgi:uncharacterized membrane protein (DUF4010 family)